MINVIFLGNSERIDSLLEMCGQAPEEACILEEHNEPKSYWSQWGQHLFEEASAYFNEGGQDENPYYLFKVNLTKKLKDDLPLIPLWSNIYTKHFSNSRIPATSAPVEGEINKFKNGVLHDIRYPIRVDDCLDRFLDYLKGKIKIVDVSMIDDEVENVTER